ncbi:protein of unknown function [Hyphomicrobium sp. 1Nfss2.1]|uniref:DUF7146 domain-containing protein n=1 Tax=Hyphomicrobium sp. 1Nfss2.1 TaxID=3413936 RepID=UPI003C7A6C52
MPAPQHGNRQSQSRGDLQDIKALLQQRVHDVIDKLGIDGYRAGKYFIGRNPARSDDKPGSFWIIIHGADAGVWKDEAVSDKAADVVALIANCKFHDPRRVKEALEWARETFGMARMSDATRAQLKTEASERKVQSDKQRTAGLARQRRYALAKWLEAGPILGTIGDTYLKGRGIDLSSLPRVPGALRFFLEHDHRDDETGEITSWPTIIAMVSPSDPASTEKLLAVHRTWLKLDGSGKAPVRPNRRIWPTFAGGIIKIARGEGGLSVKDAIAKGHKTRLIMGEGIETCGSIAVADHRPRVHAYMALANLMHIKIPVECTSEVLLIRENDASRQARALFDKGAAAIAAQGVPVLVTSSHFGSDPNDALTGNISRKG